MKLDYAAAPFPEELLAGYRAAGYHTDAVVPRLLATNVFDMPASMFSRYLDFFDIEKATPMVTWKGGTREIYRRMTAQP